MSPLSVSKPRRRRLVTVRQIQLLLALLWILDGALQLQPFMFTKGFAQQVIAPTAKGQPAIVAVPVAWSAHLIAAEPVLLDAVFATVQLCLGVGLLWRRSVKVALGGSVLWALGVWYMGEGLGGVAGGPISLLTGAPGAVLIYAVLAAAAFPSPILPLRRTADQNRPREGRWDRPLPRWASWAWAAIWIGDASLTAIRGGSGLAATIAGNAEGAPSWLSTLDHHIVALVGHTSGVPDAALLILEVVIGFLPLLGRIGRVAGCGTGLALLAVMWLVGQSMGQLYSGQATDPNTAVPLAVMALGVLSSEGTGRIRLIKHHHHLDERGADPHATAERLAA